MTRQFTFSDAKSDKFWHIHTHETALTVTFGRIGTTGQSQTKTFETATRCEQEAAKLTREKTVKGYVEQGDSAVPQPVAQANDNGELEAILKRYDEIIRNTEADQLLPFLKGIDKKWYKELGKKIVDDNTKHRDGTKKLTRGQWDLVSTFAIAIVPYEQAKKSDIHSVINGYLSWEDIVLPLLKFSRPNWLNKYLNSSIKLFGYCSLSHQKLRELEIVEAVAYEPELFSLALKDRLSTGDLLEETELLKSDPTIFNRDIPSFFDYPVSFFNTYDIKRNESGQLERILRWPIVFTRLLNEGKLDRLWFFERCLSVQTKDWPADLRSFYRKQIEANNPTTTEWLALQPSLFPLLAAEHPHVVNWTAGVVKTLHTEPDFNATALLDWVAPSLSRSDCKTAIKTLLPVLERLLKTQPDLRPTVAGLLAEVFAVPDLTLQTKAAALLAKHADPANAPLCDQLQTYAGQMLGNVPNDLRQFLTAPQPTDAPETTSPVSYQYAPPKPVQRLVPGQEVRLPETWNEFLFLIGKFITSDDPLDMEILMNALILQPKDRPDDWREQLKVYEKQLGEGTTGAARSYTIQYLRHYLFEEQEPDFLSEQYTIKLLLHRLQIYRLCQLSQKLNAGTQLPFLSLPTHAPFWIAPKILVERLLLYQQADEFVDPLDLVIALSRMSRECTEEVIPLINGLTGNPAQLVSYCLGLTKSFELPKAKGLNRFVAMFMKNSHLSSFQGIWATVARTFYPDEIFPQFSKTTLASYPNVIEPYAPQLEVGPDKFEQLNHYTKKMQVIYSWIGLKITFPTLDDGPVTLLHSTGLDVNNYAFAWDCRYVTQFDFLFSHTLTPQFTDGLFVFVAKYGCAKSDLGSSATHALHLMLQPGFQFREMSMLVLACGLLAQKRETATLAAEVVIHHVGEQTLDVDRLGDRLGWLLAGNYAPVQRLADALNLVRDVSPLHNKALLLTLNALFAQLATGDEPPKNTKKLLELYLDLLVKLNETVSPQTAQNLLNWQKINALKKGCEAIVGR